MSDILTLLMTINVSLRGSYKVHCLYIKAKSAASVQKCQKPQMVKMGVTQEGAGGKLRFFFEDGFLNIFLGRPLETPLYDVLTNCIYVAVLVCHV